MVVKHPQKKKPITKYGQRVGRKCLFYEVGYILSINPALLFTFFCIKIDQLCCILNEMGLGKDEGVIKVQILKKHLISFVSLIKGKWSISLFLCLV